MRAKLMVRTKSGNGFSYICDRNDAADALNEFENGTGTKVGFHGTVDDIDANAIEAVFDSESIESMVVMEIKGL